jgi:hypothetical protein
MILACSVSMAAIFFIWLGHDVDTLSELQFCDAKVKFTLFISPQVPCEEMSELGDLHVLVHIAACGRAYSADCVADVSRNAGLKMEVLPSFQKIFDSRSQLIGFLLQ